MPMFVGLAALVWLLAVLIVGIFAAMAKLLTALCRLATYPLRARKRS